MREPRWLRPVARVYLIVTSALWVTATTFELLRSIVGGPAGCEEGEKAASLPVCAVRLPIWAAALVGVLGVLAAYLAARLTRPRSV